MEAIVHYLNNQNHKIALMASVPFLEMKGKVEYSWRQESEDNTYQREVEDKRLSSIRRHIYSTLRRERKNLPSILFPSSLILSVEEMPDKLQNVKVGDILKDFDLEEGTLIVDGQHRFKSMEMVFDELCSPYELDLFGERINSFEKRYIENYRFNCVILINFDLYEQARIFADINFNQKPVNRSLFFDIYGVLPPMGDELLEIPQQSEIFIAHSMVKYLNEKDDSVLKGLVKMLGKEPGFITQAFFVNALIPHLKPSGIWNYAVPNLRKGGKLYENCLLELRAYLMAIKETFEDVWPKWEDGGRPTSILCKTTGMGAILKLLKNAHYYLPDSIRNVLKDMKVSVPYLKIIKKEFLKYLSPLKDKGNYFFNNNGRYAKTGGSGLQTQLYKDLLKAIEDDYKPIKE